ncbi:MAG: hypothetical protein GXP45_01050 [bacterium]|nr:hypothetical protein [bacterium]
MKDYFNIQIDPEHFFKKLLVYKIDQAQKSSLGYFPSVINREGELKMNPEKNIKQYDRFAHDELPSNITIDLKKIIEASYKDLKYLEILKD